jgi:hyperosmotically inducible periplasmic protein
MKTLRSISAALLVVSGCGLISISSGCAGTPTRKSTGEFFDDATITAKVKAALVQDPVVSALDVGVDTFKGHVQLNGFVDTPEQKARAEQIARTVSGVTEVGNKLSVKSQIVR